MKPAPEHKPLYMADITRRVLAHIDAKRKAPGAGRAAHLNGFSLQKLARESGIPYWTLYDYVARRSVPISLSQLDHILYGLKMSILDFIKPEELAERFDSYDAVSRYNIKRFSKGILPSGKPRRPRGTTSTKNSTNGLTISLDTESE